MGLRGSDGLRPATIWSADAHRDDETFRSYVTNEFAKKNQKK